ncbi:MAG: IreB family regulatory phosphoprotein [Clostridia bacterium]
MGADFEKNLESTVMFRSNDEDRNKSRQVMLDVYEALEEKGYNAVNQLAGYMLAGDPAYITSYKDSRALISKLERDEIMKDMLLFYLGKQE